MSLRIAYVVPTKDRPDDLRKLLTSLREQTVIPSQIVVVDGSNPDIRPVCEEFASLPITYVRSYPPSLARQRNAGMAALAADIEVAGYLDDDLVLEPMATEKMLEFWRTAPPEVGGSAMTIINEGVPRHMPVLRFFGMQGCRHGEVLPSGHATHIPCVPETLETDWLYGGATLWRRKVIDEFSYDEWYTGHGFLEDLDYSFRVSRKYRLFVVADARTYHFSRDMALEKMYDLGRQQVFNRIYFVKKMRCFSWPAVLWALSGLMAMNLFAGLRRPRNGALQRFRGNMVGLLASLVGRRDPFAGFWKS